MAVKPVPVLIILVTLLCLAGCDLIAGKPGILGTWEADDSPGYIFTFRADGTVVMIQDGQELPARDFAMDNSTTPITLTIDGKQGTALFTDLDHVTITDHQGDARSFHRK